jgi:uncharacterized protein YggE
MNRLAPFAALIAIAPLATPATAQTAPASVAPMIPAAGTVLDVTAEGRTMRVPDLATIRAGVVTHGATAAQAMTDNAAAMARVMAALRKAGVAARDLATTAVQLQPQYRYVENQAPTVTGYQATNSVSVRFRDIARSGAILDALVGVGANQIDGPSLSVAEPDAALDEARAEAVKRAQARAELYAKAAGLRVVRLISIAEAGSNDGGPDRPPMMFVRMAKADAPPTEIAPGEKEITASVQVRFLLDR